MDVLLLTSIVEHSLVTEQFGSASMPIKVASIVIARKPPRIWKSSRNSGIRCGNKCDPNPSVIADCYNLLPFSLLRQHDDFRSIMSPWVWTKRKISCKQLYI
ncbi:uncharacterized protein LOC111031523 [Myzus persicae]|uniref:uncharacterized protein LOC111031523 n=1 Tax=Myzus persicae TaxID=13164 RepID=UPI000B9316EC|nr:uncharacterized protein LOC111031523 [Myzus persicae]